MYGFSLLIVRKVLTHFVFVLRENLTLPSLGNLFLNWICIALDSLFLACGVLKTKKCKKRCIGFEGNCCQSFFFSFQKPMFLFWP